MVVLGGMGTVIGPVIGAAALLLLEEFIPEGLDLVRAGWGEHWRIVLGPLLLAIVLFAPRGLLGLLLDGRRAGAPSGSTGGLRSARRPAMADAAGHALLRTAGLSRSFGGVVATDNLDLTVRYGEAHAVIGPNGAGKTTLIAQLAGELAPSARRIWFDGEDITGLPAHARVHIGIARSFQITNVLPSFTVAENLQVALRPRRGHSVFLRARPAIGSWSRRCTPCSSAWGSPGLDALARELAHGEQRQLELAMALASAPRLLLLDEPMAGSAMPKQGMIELLLRIKRNCAMLLIEHDMDAVFRIADRITVLVGGRAIASGAPEAIRDDPVRAAYLGEARPDGAAARSRGSPCRLRLRQRAAA